MIVFIKDVEIGAFDWSAKPEDQIINFWIKGELQSGRVIRIFISLFEELLYEIKEYIDQKVNCLLYAEISTDFRSKNNGHNDFEGTYLGEYEITPEWLNYLKYPRTNGYCGFQTEDGILMIWCDKYKKFHFVKNKTYKFNVKEFGLRAWYPMED